MTTINPSIEGLRHVLREKDHTEEEIDDKMRTIEALMLSPPRVSRRILLAEYINGHLAPQTKESIEVPPLDDSSVYPQKEWLEKCIIQNIRPSLTSDCETVDGRTQEAGKKLEDAFEEALIFQGATYVRAGSQQPIDFRYVIPSTSWKSGELFIECKKTNGTKIVLNDSMPKRGSWYVVYSVKTGDITLILADILLKNDMDQLEEFKRIIECLRCDYKTIGDYCSVARMTLGIDVRRYIESKQRIFWDTREDPPPLQNLKDKKE